eukprot:gene2462-67320_t
MPMLYGSLPRLATAWAAPHRARAAARPGASPRRRAPEAARRRPTNPGGR